MSARNAGFPQQSAIRSGATLGAIAHAVFVCRNPDLSNEQSWDGANYNFQDSAGSRGTIAFDGARFVAVFFLVGSDRNPLAASSPYDIEQYFTGLPTGLRSLAFDEALQYVLEEYNGQPTPLITAAFWGDGVSAQTAAAEPWTAVFDHGATLVEKQLLRPDLALPMWVTEYELSTVEVELINSLFARKKTYGENVMEFNDSERSLWKVISDGQSGMDESLQSFQEMKILPR